MQKKVIHWFRQDLRLMDNPALCHAADSGDVLPVYILDNVNTKECYPGLASRCWLHHSLKSLERSFKGDLSVFQGDPLKVMMALCQEHQVEAVFWNRCYEPWQIDRDQKIKEALLQQGIKVHSYNASLLWEPWEIKKADGTHYKVFTPFYRKGCLNARPPREPLNVPSVLKTFKDSKRSMSIDQLCLVESKDVEHQILQHWKIGEQGAQERLTAFLQSGVEFYKQGRDFPAKPFTSRLSPYLHIGEISPNQIWYAARLVGDDIHVDHFCSELGWREFSYSLLYYYPLLRTENLQSKFDQFPWKEDAQNLKAWQLGKTGVPMVDAGMRQLSQTGYMHNRVRMIVGSYLVKNLMMHWHHGERWFWEHLVDADLASNSASWQWVAGCGADAAPYFRIFNPVTQGLKFDPDGVYIRQFVPEISNLPTKYLYSPWEAPEEVLEEAGVKLGKDYPYPIVDLKVSRQLALDAYASIKGNQDG